MTKLAQLLADARAEGWADWIRSEADERAVLDGCWFDVRAANRWVAFFERYLVHTMGQWAGQPFKLLQWQANEIVRPLYGWKRDKARPHLRRYTKADVFVAKKQGKSTIAAGISLGTMFDGGHRAEIYGVAHSREQGTIIYREAAAMAKVSPMLSKHLEVIESRRRIVYGKMGSFYQVLCGEAGVRSVEGINPLLIIFDEIHVQRDRALYDALTYASAARENSLMLSVSTVGIEDKTTIWWEQYEYAKGILSGTITDHARFAYIAQADDKCKDDPEARRDPAQWAKAMPSLGVTVQPEKVEEAVREAENSPAKLNNLLRYIFNIPVAQIERAIAIDAWRRCGWAYVGRSGEKRPFPDLSGRECFGGLDVASHEDLSAWAMFFPPIEGETKGWLKIKFWCPEEKVTERERKSQFHYRNWVRQGWLHVTPGKRIDHDTILEAIYQDAKQYRLREIGFDIWGADPVVNQLDLNGFTTVAVAQTFAGMSDSCHELLDAMEENTLIHESNPVMEWCCSNVAAEVKADRLRFDKDKSAEKIDGVIAAAIAMGRAAVYRSDLRTYYEENSLEVG